MSFWQQSFGVEDTTEENNNNDNQERLHESDDMIANDSFWDDDAYDDDDFGEKWDDQNDSSFPNEPSSAIEIQEEEVSRQNYEAYIAPNNVDSQMVEEHHAAPPFTPPQVAQSLHNDDGVPQAFEEVDDSVDHNDTNGALVEYSNDHNEQEEGFPTTDEFPSPSNENTREWPKETIEGNITAGAYLPQRTEYSNEIVAVSNSYDYHFTTPTRQDRHSQFVFLSDQKSMPSELKRLQEKTRRRRRDMNNQFHKLELQIAGAASSFAEEKMDLGLAICDTFQRACCQPLEEAADRIAMERETVMDRRPAVSFIEKRQSKLSVDMMRHVHVEMNDAKRSGLDNCRRDLLQEIIPSMRIEKSMADKIEGGVVRRYETSAGQASQNFHQECAARKASLEMFHRKMKQELQTQEQHSEDILDVIRSLRLQLQMEREERKVADKKLLDDVTKTSIAMRRAFLAAFDDSST